MAVEHQAVVDNQHQASDSHSQLQNDITQLTNHMQRQQATIPLQSDMTQQYTLQEQEYGGSAWCGVPVYSSTFAVSHSNYLWSDDKTPLT